MFSFFPKCIQQSGRLNGIVQGTLEAVVELPITVGAIYLETTLYSFFGKKIEKSDLLDLDSDFSSLLWEGAVAGIKEEIFFRGFLMPIQEKLIIDMGVDSETAMNLSIVGTGLLFGSLHSPGNKLHASISGITYGMLMNSFGLISSITAHFTHNAVVSMYIALTKLKQAPLLIEHKSNMSYKKPGHN